MSTRCNIAIRHEDGSVIGTSVHWDGYPANRSRRSLTTSQRELSLICS